MYQANLTLHIRSDIFYLLNTLLNILKEFFYKIIQKFIVYFTLIYLVPRKLVGMFESQQSPALRPNSEWHDVFLDPNVVQLFFKVSSY